MPDSCFKEIQDIEARSKKTIRDIEKRYLRITFRYAEKCEAMKQYAEGLLTREAMDQYLVQLDLMNDHDFAMIDKSNAEFMLTLFEPREIDHV